jgi:hypothetical protein
MSDKLPYVVQPGCITKILNKIKEAATPERFSYEYLESTLGFKGGNYKQFVSLAKKLTLLNADATPSDLYKKFRNKETSEHAIASAIKIGYKDVFERNENAQLLTKDQFKGLVVEITGLKQDDRVVQLICQTFETLKQFANFKAAHTDHSIKQPEAEGNKGNLGNGNEIDMNLTYTINLVLPKTDDPAVFNAIFKSLRENLLRK